MNTNPKEFIKFYNALMSNAPKDYVPWFFPVVTNDKYPDALSIWKLSQNHCLKCNVDWKKLPRGNKKIWLCPSCGASRSGWKEPHARMNYDQCIQRLKEGGNIGFSARANDPVVIIDKDDPSVEDLKKETLTLISRSRKGKHWIGWKGEDKIKCNIPTREDVGEVRSNDQYIVAPGSFCEVKQ